MPAGEQEISDMLGSLKRVGAPGDFGFKVRARIAGRRPSGARRSWLPASAAVAAPLGLVLAVGGYFTLTTFYSPSNVQGPATAELAPAALPPAEIAERPVLAGQPVFEVPPDTLLTSASPELEPRMADLRTVDPTVKKTMSAKKMVPANGGGSLDTTLGIPHEVNVSLSAKDVLSDIGVDANLSGSSWTVGTVRQNSAAARSGLKAGDVIEAVNDKPLSGAASFPGKFVGHSVRVRRDGKVVQIPLGR
jgi:membrane-associated protease RseP (regulator of RpoE activity)